MQIGALVVGVEDYLDPAYRQSQFRLQYAIEDANAFARYLATAWQDETLFIRCISNEQATAQGISAAAEWLAEQRIDILFVYLSGHGEVDSEGNGWFCLVDAVPAKRSLDGGSLDVVFSKIRAPISLLLIDCCYAESILFNSRFFSNLNNARARLFLCSSRSDQRTWEDDGVRHEIFSNILLRSLSTASPVASPSGLIDIEGALFPYLCEQVPLAVVAAKGGQRQEPVKGGMSSGPVSIPTVSAKLLGRQLSTYDAVLIGTRRWLSRVAIAAVLALVTIQLAFYHLAIGPTGEIEVRPGLRATEFSWIFGRSVETGITQTSLATDQEDPAGKVRSQLVALAEGRIWGISLHRQDDGLKEWFGQLLPMLKRGDRAHFAVLATGRLTPGYTSADPEREAPPFRTILEAALLNGNPGPDASTNFHFDYDLPSAADLDCSGTVANVRDFTLSEPDSSVIAADLSWSAARAVFQPSTAVEQAIDAAKVVAYRIAESKEMPKHYSPSKESGALAATLLAVSKIAASAGRPTPDPAVPASPPGSWCEPGLASVGLFLGGQEEHHKASIALAGSVGADADTINDPVARAKSEAALAALQVFARSEDIPAAAIDAIVKIVENNEHGLDGEPVLSQWFRSIAPYQTFSRHSIAWLFSQLNHAYPVYTQEHQI